MNFEELVRKRQSCRSFDKCKEISREDVEFCVEMARLGPSACNVQPFKFAVCFGEIAEKIAVCTQVENINFFTSNAPCMVVVSREEYNVSPSVEKLLNGIDFRDLDIGIAVAHFTLAAEEKGLATCVIGSFDERGIQELIGSDETVRLVIAVGYAAENTRQRRKIRRALDDMASFKE